jgi:hypothetical protein
MKRFLAALGAIVVGLASAVTLVATAPSASAYPDAVCTVSVQPQRVVGGKPITVTGTSTTSRTWTFTFNGQTATGKGTRFRHVFATPTVTKQTTLQVKGSCNGGAVQVVPATVLPGDGAGGGTSGPGQGAAEADHNGILPGTGGPAFWVLVAALLLLLAGLGTMVRSRRRGSPTT